MTMRVAQENQVLQNTGKYLSSCGTGHCWRMIDEIQLRNSFEARL